MAKKNIGAKTFLYPMPVVLIGAMVNGKPNFATLSYCGIVNHTPPMLSIAIRSNHYTNFGIRETGVFSVNIPSQDMVKVVDYCGLTSGANTDKSKIFEVCYGQLPNAPLIQDCPLNLECKVMQVLEFNMRNTYIGEIVACHADEKYLTNGLPDVRKMKPFMLSMHDNTFWAVGDFLGYAWKEGLSYVPK